MGNAFYFSWEPALMIALQQALGQLGAALAGFLTLFGEETVLILVLGFLYWCYDKSFGRYVGIGILAGICVNPMIKCVALRLRPYMVHPEISCLKPVSAEADIYDISAQGYSFPSGHSMNAAIVYGSLPVYLKKRDGRAPAVLKVTAFLLPFLVGFSRIVLGNHYPTDVLFGWFCGAFIVVLFAWLSRRLKAEWHLWVLTAVVCLPGVFYCRTEDYFTGYGLLLGFVLAMFFEQRFVNFEPTRQPVKILLRVLGGAAVYLILNSLLKLPFSADFLASGSLAALLVRLARYTIVSFVMLGIYPMIFRKGKEEQEKDT